MLLDLTDAFARQIHDLPQLLRAQRTAFGHIQGTTLRKLVDFEIRKVDLDGTCARRDVQVEMVTARNEGAWPGYMLALFSSMWALHRFRIEATAFLQCALGEASHVDGPGAYATLTP